MPTYVIRAPNGKDLEVDADHAPTDADKVQIFSHLGITSAPLSPPAPGTGTALGMAAAGAAVPMAQRVAEHVATSPAVAKIGSAIGQISGGIGGLMHGGPLEAAGGAWTGGRAGYFTGKLAQRMAAPIAKVLEAVAPYAQTVLTLSGAQGALDLAQMAEPNRQDIGTLGIGPSVSADELARTGQQRAEQARTRVQAEEAKKAAAFEKVKDAVKSLMDFGMSRGEATSSVMNAGVKHGQ